MSEESVASAWDNYLYCLCVWAIAKREHEKAQDESNYFDLVQQHLFINRDNAVTSMKAAWEQYEEEVRR